jgi:molybdopterin molybdotransferase
MLGFEAALDTILSSVQPLGTEDVFLLDALDRILAEDIVAPWNLPRFNNSAMDGYAVRLQDCSIAAVLTVIDHVPAGSHATKAVTAGTAIKIMTGAPTPEGCNTVIPLEDVEETDSCIRILRPVKAHSNLRLAGEDVSAGELVLQAGTVVQPPAIGVLASFGHSMVKVIRQPRVAIVATGSELVKLGSLPAEGQIIDSNTYTLASAVTKIGAIPVALGIVRDDVECHREILRLGLRSDVLITSAGVSVGTHDFVRSVLDELGVTNIFCRVQVKPGKSIAFGMKENKPVFALPGNPVSSMLTFEEFVAPALLKMTGHTQVKKPMISAVLQQPLSKPVGRTHLLRVHLKYSEGHYQAWSAGRQETSFLKTMVNTNAIAVLPAEQCSFAAGSEVQVHLLGEAFRLSSI